VEARWEGAKKKRNNEQRRVPDANVYERKKIFVKLKIANSCRCFF
jgi:hypothetical protein